jgi:ABC-type cobalamin/Fe3+-siderophores transport system ATPase subunit
LAAISRLPARCCWTAAAGELEQQAFARKVAYLPQQLPPAEGMTVRELVAITLRAHGALGRWRGDREKVEEAIALVGLKPLAHPGGQPLRRRTPAGVDRHAGGAG